MQIKVIMDGWEDVQIVLEAGKIGRSPKLIVNGRKAPKGKQRGEFLLRSQEGAEVPIRLRYPNPLDPIQQVECEGKRYRLIHPWTWYDGLWLLLPLILLAAAILAARMVAGWWMGLLAGGLAALTNTRLFRVSSSIKINYGLTGLVTLTGVLVFFGWAYVFNMPAGGFYIRGPKEFRAETLDFSVMTPIQFKGKISTEESANGKTTVTTFSPSDQSQAYRMVVTDYPEGTLAQIEPDAFFDHFRDSALQNGAGQLLRENRDPLTSAPEESENADFLTGADSTEAPIYPSQILTIKTQKNDKISTMWTRLVIAGDRLYQLMVISTPDEAGVLQAENFINSFKITAR